MSHGNPSFAANHLLYSIAPQLVDNNVVSTTFMPLADLVRLTAIINVGATDALVDAAIYESAVVAGTNPHKVADAEIVQLTKADGDDTVHTIDVEISKFGSAAGYRFAALTITVGAGDATGAMVAGHLIGLARNMPVTQPAAYEQEIEVAG